MEATVISTSQEVRINITNLDNMEKDKLLNLFMDGCCLYSGTVRAFEQVTLDMKDNMEYFQKINFALAKAEIIHKDFPSDPFRQLSIMIEEAGEVSKALNDLSEMHSGDDTREMVQNVREELYQTAAMCVRMLKNLKI